MAPNQTALQVAYWRFRKQGESNARLITNLPIHKITSKTVMHANHTLDICRVTVLCTQEWIKALVAASHDAPVKIVHLVTTDVAASSRKHIPSNEALRKIARKRNADCPHEPPTVQALIIEGTTLDGREFLRCDCTSTDGAWLLIFFTDENSNDLNDTPVWLMEGKFIRRSSSSYTQFTVILMAMCFL